MLGVKDKLEDPADRIRQYQLTNDMELRNGLLMEYLYIPRSAAVQLRGILSNALQEEDLVNQGVITLMECMDRYDSTKGAKFETYAFLRVKGALIDYIRKQDFVPHHVRRLSRQIDKAYMEVANKNMKEPTLQEVADYMELPGGQIDKNVRAMNNAVMLSYENVLQDVNHYVARGELECKERESKPEDNLFYKEIKKVLADAIEELGEKERLVITLYYYEELKYIQIADILGIGESRVCQLHTRAILKLKTKLESYMKG